MEQTYTFPVRKAAPLPQSPTSEGFTSIANVQHRGSELHSPLSPLSPGSPIYPDGIFTPLWLAKHQQQVPALLIAFFELSAEDESAQNDRIQSDINAIRTSLSQSGFKTRFATVLLSDRSILHAPELEDRIAAIRRATSLDSKSGLFFMPPMSSPAEIATFVQGMLTTLQPLVVDYYRELTKHARRKKARGGSLSSLTSPVEGGAHALSTSGWNVRYEVKQAIFAEFRQEMDVAERHYSAAIDELFNAEGVFETTPSWSPRWEDARRLCDALAIRTIRCQLWSASTTGAVTSWSNYLGQVKDLLDRRAKGTRSYAWDAWESRWAEVMAQLVRRAAVPAFETPEKPPAGDAAEQAPISIFALPEKSFAAVDRLPPFQLLHHAGYWLWLAIRAASARHNKAMAIPEEDRIPPGQSPASSVALRSKKYDTYLVPEPYEEHNYTHLEDIQRLTQGAVNEFKMRGQLRMVENLNLRLAKQMATSGRSEDALEILLPLWEGNSLRSESWKDLFRACLALLHDSAAKTGRSSVFLATLWELVALKAAPQILENTTIERYFAGAFQGAEKVALRHRNLQRLSPVSVHVAFAETHTDVGDQLECQLTLRSRAASSFEPLTVSNVLLRLSDGKTLKLSHVARDDDEDQGTELVLLWGGTLDEDGLQSCSADLRLPSGRKRVYSCMFAFREAGAVHLQQASVVVDNEHFSIEHTWSDRTLIQASAVWVQQAGDVEERVLPYEDTTSLDVRPKPPKVHLVLHGAQPEYYVNERITLEVEILNNEAEAVIATAQLAVLNDTQATVEVQWDGAESADRDLPLAELFAGASHRAGLRLAAPLEPVKSTLTVNVSYTLASDPQTTLIKTISADVAVVAPFTASYKFGPLLHPDPWPSYFAMDAVASEQPEGISQRWRLGATLRSLAARYLVIHSMRLWDSGDSDDAGCAIPSHSPIENQTVASRSNVETGFEFITKKVSLDDRRPTRVELSIDVEWSRVGAKEPFTTTIDIPSLNLPNTEPRVLCTVADTAPEEDGFLVLAYHLENPSAHFLTFVVTMEASDEFGFNGPKHRALSVAPLSRVRFTYNLLVHDLNGMLDVNAAIHPLVRVVDSYYKKALRVDAGDSRVRVDDKGSLSVLLNHPDDSKQPLEREVGLNPNRD